MMCQGWFAIHFFRFSLSPCKKIAKVAQNHYNMVDALGLGYWVFGHASYCTSFSTTSDSDTCDSDRKGWLTDVNGGIGYWVFGH